MKITDIIVTPVAVPVKPAETASKMRIGARVMPAVLVEVLTDEGITGIGESPSVLGLDLTAEFVGSAKEFMVGEDPSQINVLMKKLYARYNLTHLHVHLGNWALNGIELALWDIAGKRAGMPLYQLWGGAYRKKIDYYGIVERQELDGMEHRAKELAEAGYKTIYTKIGMDPEDDVAAVAAMRRGAPDRSIKIRVDANQSWNTGTAIKVINEMAQYDVDMVEQPVLMYNLDALREVRNHVSVPILGHESNWTMYDMLNVIKANAVDYVKLDARFDLGYTGVRISAGMAESAGIQCVHHSFFELGIAFAANMHVIASCPNFTTTNSNGEYDRLEDDVLVGGLMQGPDPAHYLVPEKPGIGVELDHDRVGKYHEYYLEHVHRKNIERDTENHYYGAMQLRSYLKN